MFEISYKPMAQIGGGGEREEKKNKLYMYK